VDDSERAFTWPAGANTHTISAALTGAIKSLRTNERTMFLKLSDQSLQAIDPPKFNVDMEAEGKTLTITFTERLPAGRYQIFIPFLWGDEPDDGGVTIDIVVS
jgi:hypothetical protein